MDRAFPGRYVFQHFPGPEQNFETLRRFLSLQPRIIDIMATNSRYTCNADLPPLRNRIIIMGMLSDFHFRFNAPHGYNE